AVHDMIVLFASVRRGGKTLGQMVKEEIGGGVGVLALISVLAIMIILLAVLALVVVQALAKSPWGVFTIAMTIPWAVIIYGLASSILPIWLLLTPRDYLSTFLKLGTVAALAVAVIVIHPTLQMPSLTKFIDGSGLVFARP